MRLRPILFWLVVLGALAPALALSLVRLVEPADGRGVRLESFTPLAVVPYAAALVVLLLASLRRRRPTVLLAAAVAAGGLALHAVWFAPMVSGANPPAPGDAETIRVMTANLHVGTADGIAVVQAAVDEDVDVLVLQEVTAPVLATMEQSGLAEVFPHRAGEPGEGAEGTMVFSRTELGAATPVPTTWDSWQVTVGELRLLAVHPHAPTDVARWRRDHGLLRDAVAAGGPDLVVGDFNATPDHPPMRALADAGYRSAAELTNQGWQPTWPAYGVTEIAGIPLPHLVQIDHVLVGPRLAALDNHTVDIAGTDHRAVVAEVALK